MKYTIRIWALGSHPETEITQAKFDEIKRAKNCLSGAFHSLPSSSMVMQTTTKQAKLNPYFLSSLNITSQM